MNNNKFSIIFGLTADPIHLGHEQVIINGIDYCRDQGFDVEEFVGLLALDVMDYIKKLGLYRDFKAKKKQD